MSLEKDIFKRFAGKTFDKETISELVGFLEKMEPKFARDLRSLGSGIFIHSSTKILKVNVHKFSCIAIFDFAGEKISVEYSPSKGAFARRRISDRIWEDLSHPATEEAIIHLELILKSLG